MLGQTQKFWTSELFEKNGTLGRSESPTSFEKVVVVNTSFEKVVDTSFEKVVDTSFEKW